MRIYIAYSVSSRSDEELACLINRLKKIDEIITSQGNETFIFLRDIQNWKLNKINRSEVLRIAFKELRNSDLLLLDIDIPPKSRVIGMSIESGYAKALGKDIIALWKSGQKVKYLGEIADRVIEYRETKELEVELPEIVFRFACSKG